MSLMLGRDPESRMKVDKTDLGDASPFEMKYPRLVLEALDFSIGPAPMALAVLLAVVSVCCKHFLAKREA